MWKSRFAELHWLMSISIGKRRSRPGVVRATRATRPAFLPRCSRIQRVASAPVGESSWCFGRDDRRERLPDRLVLAVAEQLVRGTIERFDQATRASP